MCERERGIEKSKGPRRERIERTEIQGMRKGRVQHLECQAVAALRCRHPGVVVSCRVNHGCEGHEDISVSIEARHRYRQILKVQVQERRCSIM